MLIFFFFCKLYFLRKILVLKFSWKTNSVWSCVLYNHSFIISFHLVLIWCCYAYRCFAFNWILGDFVNLTQIWSKFILLIWVTFTLKIRIVCKIIVKIEYSFCLILNFLRNQTVGKSISQIPNTGQVILETKKVFW